MIDGKLLITIIKNKIQYKQNKEKSKISSQADASTRPTIKEGKWPLLSLLILLFNI